jgi:adenylate cyclase
MRAVCIATDAEGSTAVGQRLSNEDYARLIRDYHEALTRPVWNRGGAALAPEGDGFAGIWCSHEVRGVHDIDAARLRACLAAIEIVEAARQFNLGQPDGKQLPVRIGLTAGAVTIHSNADRGVFTAVGDAMNVAARLRDLNREVGSRILASEDVVRGLETRLQLRRISGDFALKGITQTPVVFEIVGLATGQG